jgi:DNA-binding NarL/FixJ family response regulator
LEEFERLGASWDAARVRSACRTQGVTLPYPWRGGRKEYGNGLSPREVEVARLAGLGKTNREIAEALVLSRNTVKHHVSSALRKLQIGSRNDLALVVLSGTSSQN